MILVAVVVAVAIAAFLFLRMRSARLRSRFGPEYDRAVQETGSTYKAESNLEKLEKRVQKFSIHPLRPEEGDRFRDAWRVGQAKFVDDPRTALSDADALIGQLMTARGYPLSDFEERAAEISVDHPRVVEHYRSGHEIAARHAQGRASTEDLRQAMIHYRMLFDELMGEPEPQRARTRAAGSL